MYKHLLLYIEPHPKCKNSILYWKKIYLKKGKTYLKNPLCIRTIFVSLTYLQICSRMQEVVLQRTQDLAQRIWVPILLTEMRIMADMVAWSIWPGAFIFLGGGLVLFILALPLTGHVTLCVLPIISDSQLSYASVSSPSKMEAIIFTALTLFFLFCRHIHFLKERVFKVPCLSNLFPQFSNIIGHYYLGLNFTESNRHPKFVP